MLKKGQIVFNNGHTSIGCQILDISEVGAKLMPIDLFSCPSEFALKSLTGEPRQCEVKWRKGAVLGVRFLDLQQPLRASDDRRRQSRRRTMQYALIVYNRVYSAMPAQIIDISDVGARLIPVDVFACTREFVLKPKNGGPRQCTVLWRRGTMIGIRFL